MVGKLGGTVVSAVDGRPLADVTVAVAIAIGATVIDSGSGLSLSTQTDGNGVFSLNNESVGSYQLTFSAPGFVAKTVTADVTMAGPTILEVTLATDTTSAGGTVGAAAASTTSTAEAPTFQLTVSSSNGSTDPYAVGFGTTVTVNVSALGGSAIEGGTYDVGSFTYSWSVSTAPTTSDPSGHYSFAGAPSSNSVSFTTMTLAETKSVEMFAYSSPIDGGAMGYIGRLGVLGINPDETGNYTVALTVTDPEGHYFTFSQPIRSTWQTPSLADVPVGNPVYLQGDTFAAPNWLEQGKTFWKWPNTSWTWTVTSAPAGSSVSTATLGDANTQYPYFVPDAVGEYDLQVVETSSYASPSTGPGWDAATYGTTTATVKVFAGTYVGTMNTANLTCKQCHTADVGSYFTPDLGVNAGAAADYFTPWQGTAHASALQRKMDGWIGSHFGESCLQCHTLGWSNVTTAQNNVLNGGFTYQMTQAGRDGGTWSWPASITTSDGGPMQPGAYEALVANFPSLAPAAGIQCENCHGPEKGPASNHPGSQDMYNARVDWSSQVCASCHEERNAHTLPSQWGPSDHGNLEVAIQRASVESKANTYGGGADPQSGAQFCARCHSAQGFVQYVRMMSNRPDGGVGRYDFITTDDKPLAADGSNTPSTEYLSSIGLNAAQVQSQTCVSCHDPHSNSVYGAARVDCSQQANNADPTCRQLRVYGSLPGLPSGQGAISGVGSGAICMMCHNGRNGEHTDTVNSSPYAETPHDSTATEALFGFNAFFVPRYNPSPHLAVKDTCTGCHVNLPTAANVSAGETVNHAFATDLTICANCHGSSGVDGNALQAQVASELSGLGAMIVNKEIADITALALDSTNGLCVRVTGISDAKNCAGGSCASSQVPSAVPFPLAPSTVWLPPGSVSSVSLTSSGVASPSTSVTLILNAPNSLVIPEIDPHSLAKVGNVTSPSSISVPIYTIQVGTGGVSGQPSCGLTEDGGAFASSVLDNVQHVADAGAVGGYVYLPSTVTAKAVWNYTMLANEGSGGIHNFPWTNAVISATEAAISAANDAGTF